MKDTPQAGRLHIGIFGRCNSGKSSIVNLLTGQNTAIVSEVAGTTTDPVNKSMEINGIGAVTIIDTAGFDDVGRLAPQRLEKTRLSADKTDVAVIVFCSDRTDYEQRWIKLFQSRNVPVVAVLNKSDLPAHPGAVAESIKRQTGLEPVIVSAKNLIGAGELIEAVVRAVSEVDAPDSILGDLVEEGDVVMLVMPQDSQAPRARLILPQSRTIRELLDKKCVVVGCQTRQMETSLASLKNAPKLIITDSQDFATVNRLAPAGSMLTSFSVLFACYKGDIRRFIEGATAIGRLTENSRVLIAEACTHVPLNEDIGRVKLPRMLRERIGEGLRIDVVSGPDFPEDLTPYDLVIHCGACMFNRRYVISRISRAVEQGVPVTNYGIAIAYLNSILDKVVYPKS